MNRDVCTVLAKRTSVHLVAEKGHVRMEQLAFHWTEFHYLILGMFAKICRSNSTLVKIVRQ